jgi:NADH:ubiquinone oxidoreductase subunit 6 (subunit J)
MVFTFLTSIAVVAEIIVFLCAVASLVYFIISLTTKDEDKKRKFRKISAYLLIPFLTVGIVWAVFMIYFVSTFSSSMDGF